MQGRERAFLEALKRHLGPDGVLAGPEASAYARCTTGVQRAIPAVLLPRSVEEVVSIVKVAVEHRVQLHPISIGNNWGYGSANPVTDGCVVVALSRLNRILEFDGQTGLVTLEPGVTQGQLADFLAERALPFMVPTTGAGPAASILGNALERGYGITPISDHFGALTSLEAVLPDGSIYRSPLVRLARGGADGGYKWGIGPYLDGLFAQGAFGIVTQGTFALARRPQRMEALLFGLKNEGLLEAAVEAVRETIAALPGTIGGVNLMDARRVLAMAAPFPRAQLSADGLIPAEVVEALARQHQVMPWTGFGTLYGTQRMVAAARSEIKARLRPLASRMLFMTPRLAGRLKKFARWIPPLHNRVGPTLSTLTSALDLMRGIPNETALPLAYWKRPGAVERGRELNPARDGCGLIWYAPLVEMKGARVREYIDLVRTLMPRFGMEPLITLTSLSERCFGSTVPILFDPGSERELRSAQACHEALLEAGRDRGFFPYRVDVQTMAWLTRQGVDHWELVAKLKAAVDPLGLISPGRYSPVPPTGARES